MKYDIDKANPINPTVDFFEERKLEIIATCIRLQPNSDGLSEQQANDIRYKAMDIVARTHEFGKYRHLCKTCHNDPTTCEADRMFGQLEPGDNVCYCEKYVGTISERNVSRGLSE